MNPVSAWLNFCSKLLDPDTKFIRECYFCHGGIPPLDTPYYVMLDTLSKVDACWFCYKARETPKVSPEIIKFVNAANSTPKEVEVPVITSSERKLKIKDNG